MRGLPGRGQGHATPGCLHDKCLANRGQHLLLRHFDNTRIREHELGIRQRMVLVIAGNESRAEICLLKGFRLTVSITMGSGHITGSFFLKKTLDHSIDPVCESCVRKTTEDGLGVITSQRVVRGR